MTAKTVEASQAEIALMEIDTILGQSIAAEHDPAQDTPGMRPEFRDVVGRVRALKRVMGVYADSLVSAPRPVPR